MQVDLDQKKMSLRVRLGLNLLDHPEPSSNAGAFLVETPADFIDVAICPEAQADPGDKTDA